MVEDKLRSIEVFPHNHPDYLPERMRDYTAHFFNVRNKTRVQYHDSVQRINQIFELVNNGMFITAHDSILTGHCRTCRKKAFMGLHCDCCHNKTCPKCLYIIKHTFVNSNNVQVKKSLLLLDDK